MTSGEPAGGFRTPRHWGSLILALGVGALIGTFLIADWSRTGVMIRGKTLGKVSEVLLVEPERGLEADADLVPGGYEIAAPPRTRTPRIEVYGSQGSVVISGALNPEEGKELQVPPLALWVAPLRVRRRDDTFRFDWAPITVGQEGWPQERKYSLLLLYANESGQRAEASFLCFDPWATLSLAELQEYMPSRDPKRTDIEVEVRAFDPKNREGALWIGSRGTWILGSEEINPRKPSEKP